MYSQKLAAEFNDRIDYLKQIPEFGKKSEFPSKRTTACRHFSIFYINESENLVTMGIYDTRRNPGDILKEIKEHRL